MRLKEWLEENNIEYWDEGKNVSDGWCTIQCPFCDDQSNHLGITPDRQRFSCFKCGEKNKMASLVKELINCDWSRAYSVAKGFIQDGINTIKTPTESPPTDKILPPNATSKLPKKHHEYLLDRRFKPNYLISKYNIKAVHNVGKYRWRIIVPYYLDGYLVTFVARDVTNKAPKKYLTCPDNGSIVTVKQTFYNIDTIEESAIIVEGVTDVWRIGNKAIAASGTSITKEQLSLLSEKNLKRVYIVMDSDASDTADKYANQIASIVKEVEVIYLYGGDPADQSPDIINKLRRIVK